jgi:CubicO group peptidase (beta-lactamase class C family)
MANILGSGDMYSTVEDMYLWDQALYTEKLLSEKYKKIMFTPFLNNYSYGWDIYKVALGESTDSVDVISHTGGILAFNTIIFRLIKDKHLIVLFNNIRYGYGNNDLSRICKAITNILYDYPYKLPKMSIAWIFQ